MPSPEEERALRHTEKLRSGDLRALEREVAKKRLTWLDAHGFCRPAGWSYGLRRVSPREAFELFFADYLGLDTGQLPWSRSPMTASPGSRRTPVPLLTPAPSSASIPARSAERSTRSLRSCFSPAWTPGCASSATTSRSGLMPPTAVRGPASRGQQGRSERSGHAAALSLTADRSSYAPLSLSMYSWTDSANVLKIQRRFSSSVSSSVNLKPGRGV